MDSDRDWQATEFIDECVASLTETLGDAHEMTRLAAVTRAQLRINALQYLGRANGGPDTPEERKTRAAAAIEEFAAILTEELDDLPEHHPAPIAIRRALADAHRENGYPEGEDVGWSRTRASCSSWMARQPVQHAGAER